MRGWKLNNCCAHHDAMTSLVLATERQRKRKMEHAEIHSMLVTIMVTQSTQILMEL